MKSEYGVHKTMGMGMSLGVGVYVRQKQTIEQMIKLSLRQELKIVLKMLMVLIQTIKMGQKVSIKHLEEIKQAVAELTRQDVLDLAHETIRRGGIERACQFGYVLRGVAQYDSKNFMQLSVFARAMIEQVKYEQERRERGECMRRHRPRITLALRMILREPNFLGGRDGTPESLADLLRSVPQTNDSGQIEWVLAGGWAAEILTGKHQREHCDVDVVLMTNRPLYLDSDVQHSTDYFGIISCGRRFLRQNCLRKVRWQYGSDKIDVTILCKEFLFLSKFLREPRDKDWDDVVELVHQFASGWDLHLMKKLIVRNCCGFNRTHELMQILRLRRSEKILEHLSQFWKEKEPQLIMNGTQKTVRELKDQVLHDAGCARHFDFTGANDVRGDFWDKLNQLGWERKTLEPEECDDVDDTAFISDTEYEELLAEARALPPV